MRRVRQRGDTDCGIACVAMLAGVPYDKARAAVCGDGATDYELRHLRAALRNLGRSPAGRAALCGSRDYRDLGKSALVRVEIGADGLGHWMVWDAERRRLVDPMEPPFERFRAVSYVLVD